jgi:hypothetical protein
MKLCPSCGAVKDTSGFHKDATKKDKLYSVCKECRRARRNAILHPITQVVQQPDIFLPDAIIVIIAAVSIFGFIVYSIL